MHCPVNMLECDPGRRFDTLQSTCGSSLRLYTGLSHQTDSYPKNSVWQLRSLQILNKVITILNLDTQRNSSGYFRPPPPPKKNSRRLKPGYTSNVLHAMAMQFQQIITLPLHAQISSETSSEKLQKY